MKEKAILVHEICGNTPVHPENYTCGVCNGFVFPAECYKIPVSEAWIKEHPQAKKYLVDKDFKVE